MKESWLLSFIVFLCHLAVIVLCLFIKVPWVGLQCVIVAFPDHIHLLFGSGAGFDIVFCVLSSLAII